MTEHSLIEQGLPQGLSQPKPGLLLISMATFIPTSILPDRILLECVRPFWSRYGQFNLLVLEGV